MPAITASEVELLSFFGSEPSKLDADAPWVYNTLTYKVEHHDDSLLVEVQPSYKIVKIELDSRGRRVYQFAGTVRDLFYRREGKNEVLELLIGDECSIELSLKPFFAVRQTGAE